MKSFFLSSIICFLFACQSAPKKTATDLSALSSREIALPPSTQPLPGAYHIDKLKNLLQGRTYALVGNQTSTVSGVHLVDTLSALGVPPSVVFAPEHGFRGEYSAGETVQSSVDKRTSIPLKSLYGKHKKPSLEDLQNIEIVVFDIQDVGARFYTYLSTMHYVMEACAEQGVSFVVLDRPNPLISIVDGPTLDTNYRSFVGMHPIPVLHGMTLGELAQMIQGEGWIKKASLLNLTIFPVSSYTRHSLYAPPIPPSPNLPSIQAIYAYPSLCFLEGTPVSAGRGTDKPFSQYMHPNFPDTLTTQTPRSCPAARYPKFQDQECYAYAYTVSEPSRIDLTPLLVAYYHVKNESSEFFTTFFPLLAGNTTLQTQIAQGLDPTEISASWQPAIDQFLLRRKPYLLYTNTPIGSSTH